MLNQQFQEPFVAVVVRQRENWFIFLLMCDFVPFMNYLQHFLNAAVKQPLPPPSLFWWNLREKFRFLIYGLQVFLLNWWILCKCNRTCCLNFVLRAVSKCMWPCSDLVHVLGKLTATVRKSQRLNSQLPGVLYDPEFVFHLYCIFFFFFFPDRPHSNNFCREGKPRRL